MALLIEIQAGRVGCSPAPPIHRQGGVQGVPRGSCSLTRLSRAVRVHHCRGGKGKPWVAWGWTRPCSPCSAARAGDEPQLWAGLGWSLHSRRGLKQRLPTERKCPGAWQQGTVPSPPVSPARDCDAAKAGMCQRSGQNTEIRSLVSV